MQLDQKALIEEAVQASIDAGLAVNGEYGVAAARHAARFMFNALQAVQPVPVVTDEMIRQAKKQIILAMQLYDFGSVSEDGNFTCSSQQIELLENRAEVAAHQALTAAFLAALRDERDILADRIRVLDPLLKERCDEAQNFYERADKAEARVRELEQKLERARVALEPFGQAANDAEEFAGHDGPIGQYIQFEILRRARAALAEIGQRG